VPLAVELDRLSPVPLYHQLAQAIEAAIRDGQLAQGIGSKTKSDLRSG
jgi:DNA-binding GntR family transcriptional regulator